MRVPETWAPVRISDVCLINPALESSDVPDNDVEVTFVPMSAIDETFGQITKPDTRQYREVARGYTAFKDNDVLYAKITPCMENGKVAIARGLRNGIGFGSTEFHILRPTEQINAEYLFYFLRQPWFRLQAKSAFTGSAGQLRVPENFLSRAKIPLPTLAEQKRIVAILKETGDIGRLREETMEEVQGLYRSVFFGLFGDPDPRRTKFKKTVTLGKITQVETGGTPDRSNPKYFGGTIPWIKSTELKDRVIQDSEEKISDMGLRSCNAKIFPPDTILVAMYGQGQTRGRTAKLAMQACCNQACAAVLPNAELLPDYIWMWFQCSYERVRALGRGGQQLNLNLDMLRNLIIPRPSEELQLKFSTIVRRLENQLMAKESMKSVYENLFADLHREAFLGDLTISWRVAHHRELQAAADIRDAVLGIKRDRETVKEFAPEYRPWMSQTERAWLKDQMSELQSEVWKAIEEWKGTLIPSDQLDEFMRTWPTEHIDNAKEKALRALNQLAGLGLIAKISSPNEDGEYVTGFRGFREEEFSRMADLEALGEV